MKRLKNMHLLILKSSLLKLTKKILVLTDLLVVYANHNSFLLKSF